jgi:exopolysaccharide production protein ExoQ
LRRLNFLRLNTLTATKYIAIILVLVLMSGAFLTLMMDDDTGMSAYQHGDEKLQWMWGAIDLVALVACAFHGRQFFRVALRQPWLLAFVAWGLLTVLWSEDPMLSLRRTLGLACTVALGFFLGMRFELKEILRIVAWALAIAVVASLAAGVLIPSFAIQYNLGGAWRGVFVQKNTMARVIGVAVMVFTFLLLESRRYRLMYLVPLFLSVALIALSKSVTAIIVTFLAISLLAFLKLRLRPTQSVALFAFVALLGLGATLFVVGNTDSIFAFMGKDASLTGRTDLWRESIAAVLRRPLLGAGWDVFWMGPDADSIRAMVGWQTPHAHNAFIDLALNTGLVGLAIFLASLFDCLRRALRYSREPDRPFNLWPLLYYSYIFFYMFTETTTVDRHSLFNVLYCALSVSMTNTVRMESSEKEFEQEFMHSGIVSDSRMIQESQ